MWIFGVTVLLMGVARAQQLTNELQHDAGYVETAPDQNYYTGQYADPGVYSAYSTDNDIGTAQLSETDRTTELIEGALSPFVMAAAFFSAMLGGIMAPIITEGFRAIASMDVPSIELPRIRRKDDKYYYQDRELGDANLIESGLSAAMETIIEAMERR